MPRPRTAGARRLVLVGVLVAACLLCGVAAALLPADAVFWITLLAGCGSVIGLCMLLWPREVWAQASAGRQVGTVAAMVIAVGLQFLLMVGVPDAVLRVRGQAVTATVVAERTEKRVQKNTPPTHNYTLATPSGRVLARDLEQVDDLFDPGDRVTVVADRWDLVDPQLPAAIRRDDGVLHVMAAVLVVLMLGLGVAAGGRPAGSRAGAERGPLP